MPEHSSKFSDGFWNRYRIPQKEYFGFSELPRTAQEVLRLRGASGNVKGEVPDGYGPIITGLLVGAVDDLRTFVFRTGDSRVLAAMSLAGKKGDNYVVLDSLAVQPDARGLGIGRTGLHFAATKLQEQDTVWLSGNAVRNPDTLRFYAQHGFDLVDTGDECVHIAGDVKEIARKTR